MLRSNSIRRHFSLYHRTTIIAVINCFICTSVATLTSHVRAQNQLDQSNYFDTFDEVKAWLDSKQSKLENSVFLSYDSNGDPYNSSWYKYDDFVRVFESLSVAGLGGGDDELRFYTGADGKGSIYGLINIAAFLAHAMTVSIQYDVCDEFNDDDLATVGQFAISNSCGQWGRNYQDEICTGKSSSMTCAVDVNATITAVSLFKNDNNTPPAFSCGPKTNATDYTGYWDSENGVIVNSAFSNRYGRIDIEGCCWWGRGVLLTRGTCQFGRINHYLGINAGAQGFLNFYDVDFCAYPEVVCQSQYSKDLRWAVGYFEWIDRVQTFNDTASYLEELEEFVESRLNDTNAALFIDTVGIALPVSCSGDSLMCSSEEDRRLADKRRKNFMTLVYDVLALHDLLPELLTTTVATASVGESSGIISDTGDGLLTQPTNFSLLTPAVDSETDLWYPTYSADNFESGICVNSLPIPKNVSTFQSELECCVKFFNFQIEGYCLKQLPSPPAIPPWIDSVQRNPSKHPTPQPDLPTQSPTFEPTHIY
eukprot:CCRYP_001284-RA/>CCRYP_001284-RA protein AED:0.17 eAED:0.17 QI:49/1/1/1/0.75/0.6/5/1327/535